MDNPFISVIIPLYNKEEFIKSAVESVINQTHKQFEIIIVNDGSSDNSVNRVREINDERVSIVNQANQGVSVARNNGIKLSKGEWIAFLDADDWWASTFLEELVNLVNAFPDKEIFATGRSTVFKYKVKRYMNKYLPPDGKTGSVEYFKVISNYFPPLHSSSALIKKDILIKEEGPFNPNQRLYEDHDLWLRLCKNRLVAVVNKNLSFHRKTETNRASSTYYDPLDFINYLNTIEKVKNELDGECIRNFAKYYNKFILLIIIKYQNNYTKQEKLAVYKKSKGIVDTQYRLLLELLQISIFKNLYHVKKKLKKGVFEVHNSKS